MTDSYSEEPLPESPDPLGEDSFLENEQIPQVDDAPEPKEDGKKPHADYTVLSGVQTVVSIALVMATLLTLWNPRKVFNTPSLASLVEAEATKAALESEKKAAGSNAIGILAGHWEDNNPGVVCADGLVEADINHDIATRVTEKLEKLGYSVDQFPEYDLKLLNFEGAAFVAIYSGSCADTPIPPSGFKIGGSFSAQNPDQIDQLATCLAQEYQAATNLPFTYEVISAENTSYHIFRDVSGTTPAVRLELGSLKTDRRVLVDQAEKAADGIVAGILCFLKSEGDRQ
jgi:N-acetylmuramoyl-L-alanine amidase